MALASMESNTTECILSEGEGMMHSGWARHPWGCLLMRVSLTEGESGSLGSEGSCR